MDISSYLSWMQDTERFPFILSARPSFSKEDLLDYINSINNSQDALMLCIFTKQENKHIGNIKFYDINTSQKTCWVGFLVGDLLWQGVGVAAEVFNATYKIIRSEFGIEQINLGVDIKNLNAVKAYLKIGFLPVKTTETGVQMAINI
jgi:RimJ/RimL family protein N-acetyltransferase